MRVHSFGRRALVPLASVAALAGLLLVDGAKIADPNLDRSAASSAPVTARAPTPPEPPLFETPEEIAEAEAAQLVIAPVVDDLTGTAQRDPHFSSIWAVPMEKEVWVYRTAAPAEPFESLYKEAAGDRATVVFVTARLNKAQTDLLESMIPEVAAQLAEQGIEFGGWEVSGSGGPFTVSVRDADIHAAEVVELLAVFGSDSIEVVEIIEFVPTVNRMTDRTPLKGGA